MQRANARPCGRASTVKDASEHLLALQALADSNTPTVQQRGLSEGSEPGILGGILPAERVFMYLQAWQS